MESDEGRRGIVKWAYPMSGQVRPNVQGPLALVQTGRICQDRECQHEGDVRELVYSAWQAQKRDSLERLRPGDETETKRVLLTCDRTFPYSTFAAGDRNDV